MAKPKPFTPITPEQLAEAGSEDAEQMALFCWASSPGAREKYPDLRWLFAIPNGGDRHKAVANKLKAMGVKPGVCDICFPVSRGSWALLWIELKVPKRADGRRAGTVQTVQTVWLNHFRSQGHGVIVCRGWEHARKVLIEYIEWKSK